MSELANQKLELCFSQEKDDALGRDQGHLEKGRLMSHQPNLWFYLFLDPL